MPVYGFPALLSCRSSFCAYSWESAQAKWSRQKL